ncbi:MAG TPA: hypothetical protein VHW96_07850 [Solirubrobacteraceae bacterium]|jgi:hypothetical protein|nr:hypothetical protein [Solirubrobacteraceae bacterium]
MSGLASMRRRAEQAASKEPSPRPSFGARLYMIWKRRFIFPIAFLVALMASIFTLYQPSLLPPGLHSRSLQIGAASTEVLVAQPNLVVGGSTYDYDSLVNRAILVGNEMASPPVLAYIGHAVGVPGTSIQASAPITANVPRALIDPGSGGAATDIIASPDHYKLEIQADPSVPILHIYAQAPSPEAAEDLATAAVQGVMKYISQVEIADNVPRKEFVQIQQLGTAHGGVANPGGSIQIVVLVFLGMFAVSTWFLYLGWKVRRGWVSARLAEQPAS